MAQRYTSLLDLIFEECASHNITLEPDEALDWMDELLKKLVTDDEESKREETTSGVTSILRFDSAAYRRDAHHYAVDRFYKTYFPRKRGAPPLPTDYVDRILRLRFKGLNYVSIAERLGQPKGTMRKQVPAVERRWRQAVERIEQIKLRSPHLVAKDPHTVKVRKQRTPSSRNGETSHKRTGK